MTVGYYPEDDYFEPVEWINDYATDSYAEEPRSRSGGLRLDGITIAAVILLLFMAMRLLLDRSTKPAVQIETAAPAVPVPAPVTATGEQSSPELAAPQITDPSTIIFPYDEYDLTQGPHGYSYGHMAIDLAAGQGTPIKSPIDGTITALYVDEWGNPTLVIENSRYRVTMLHGDYTVQVGQQMALGETVGTESNHGYTLDLAGNSCRYRDCGYHTHLNVFDKQAGSNVNPLNVLQ